MEIHTQKAGIGLAGLKNRVFSLNRGINDSCWHKVNITAEILRIGIHAQMQPVRQIIKFQAGDPFGAFFGSDAAVAIFQVARAHMQARAVQLINRWGSPGGTYIGTEVPGVIDMPDAAQAGAYCMIVVPVAIEIPRFVIAEGAEVFVIVPQQ